jgi:hypothetical protein
LRAGELPWSGRDGIGQVVRRRRPEIESRIENGFGLMAPVDLSEQETADVIAYVRQEFGS